MSEFFIKYIGKEVLMTIMAFFTLALALFFAACSDDNSNYFPVVPEKVFSSEILSSSSIASSSDSGSLKTNFSEGTLSISTTVVEDTFDLFYYGSVNLNFTADSFLTKFDYGDIVTVMVAGFDTVDVPVVASYNEVTAGEFLLYVGRGSRLVSLEVVNGMAAEAIGFERDVKFPIDVVIQMKKKGGYAEYLEMYESMTMSYYVDVYPNLTIEEFANFRMVQTTGIGEGVLYRSSSPVNPSLDRNLYADSLSWVAGIETFVNLAESMEYATTYRNFAMSYYATRNVVYLNLPATFVNKIFKDGLVQGFRYIIEHDGPYLVHCTYGMDRTGFTIAVLEALMGATADEIKTDYAKSYTNYFSVYDGVQVALTPKQVDLVKEIIAKNLRNSYHTVGIDISDFENVDLALATEKYLLALGMEKGEIEALKARLK